MERNGVVRRFRPADGACLGAPRPHVAGDPRGPLDRFPPARAARDARPALPLEHHAQHGLAETDPAGRVGLLRHDLMSQETHAARWIGFRQPVLRVMLERQGRTFDFTWQAHEAVGLGQVWEEDEFWIELSWRIDPDGSLGVRKYFESPYRPGQKLRVEEGYRWIFERSVPGLPDAAAREGLTPLAYMRKYGAFLVEDQVYRTHEQPLSAGGLDGAPVGSGTAVGVRDGQAVGLEVDGGARLGFPTPSPKPEVFSWALKGWEGPPEA